MFVVYSYLLCPARPGTASKSREVTTFVHRGRVVCGLVRLGDGCPPGLGSSEIA